MINNSHGKRMVREDLIKVLKDLASKKTAKKVEATNIKELSTDVLNGLECGDIVMKKTGNQYHSYIVTYKEANQGICLTYVDASVVETQSYDYVDGAWVYNSEDKTSLELKPATASRLGGIKVGSGLSITSGGVLSASGGALYLHTIILGDNADNAYLISILSSDQNGYTTVNQIIGKCYLTSAILSTDNDTVYYPCTIFELNASNLRIGYIKVNNGTATLEDSRISISSLMFLDDSVQRI